jgi:small conductance mechanosensitive channel
MELINFDLQAIIDAIVAFLPQLGLGLLVYLIARWLSGWASRLLRTRLERRSTDPEIIVLLQMLTRWGILALGIILALEQLAPGRLTTLLAGVGILGVTIGFALQDIAKNFVSGVLLLITQPFDLGDTISVSDYTGKVTAINLRSTELSEVDGRFVIIPNADVFVRSIVNYSRSPHRRVELKIMVAPDTDLEKAVRIGLESLEGVAGVMDEPKPVLVFGSFGESSIDGFLRYWVDTSQVDSLKTQHIVVQNIQRGYDVKGIVMPYPALEVTMMEKKQS